MTLRNAGHVVPYRTNTTVVLSITTHSGRNVFCPRMTASLYPTASIRTGISFLANAEVAIRVRRNLRASRVSWQIKMCGNVQFYNSFFFVFFFFESFKTSCAQNSSDKCRKYLKRVEVESNRCASVPTNCLENKAEFNTLKLLVRYFHDILCTICNIIFTGACF